jgi:choline kinase
VLLAAGRGARLRPLTDSRPKALLDVAGSPLVVRAVGQLAHRGLTRFTIVDGYRGDMVRAALLDRYPREWFRFVRNEAWETTNNAYSLHLARDEGGERDAMFLLDCDIAFAPGVLDRLLDDPHPNRLAVRTRGGLGSEEMKVSVGPDARVTDVGKEIDPAAAIGESVGLEVFSLDFARRLFAALDRRVRDGAGRTEFYESAFVEVIRSGAVVHPIDLGDLACLEIDTADDLEHAQLLFGGAR